MATIDHDIDGFDPTAWTVADQLARSLHLPERGLQETLDAVVAGAIGVADAADYGGLIVVEGGELIPKSTLGRPPETLDLLQQRLGGGPCFHAASAQELVQIADVETDGRWERFCTLAAELGVRSVVCAPLWISERSLGSLSLYSERVDAFSGTDVQLVSLFATHAALALAHAHHAEQLRAAYQTRDIIGQAKGILMERFKLDADAAFKLLAETSQSRNQRLSDLADELARTGTF